MTSFSKTLALVCLAALLAGCGTEVSQSPQATATHPPKSAPATAPSSAIPPSPVPEVPMAQPVTTADASSRPMAAIQFLNTNLGYLAGSGQIWKTTDGGQQWTDIYDSGTANFRAIQFLDANVGWIWGYRTLMETSNGGKSWHVQHHSASPIVSLSMVSPQAGFAVIGTPSAPSGPGGPGNAFYETSNGGKSWHTVATPFHPLAVTFANAEDGWVVGDNHVWATSDGGHEWIPTLEMGSTVPMAATIRAQGHHLWVLLQGQSGMNQTSYTLFEKTAGKSWQVVLAKSTAGAGPAPDAPQGAAQGPELAPGPLAVLSGGTAYFAGESAAQNLGTTDIWSTANGGASWIKNPPLYGVNGMPGPDALSFVSPQDGWLVAGSGSTHVLRTTNGGSTWHQVFPAPTPVRGVSFVSPSRGYGLGLPGNPNAVLESTNKGASWGLVSSLPASGVWINDLAGAPQPAIVFTSATVGWLVRADRLWHTTDGGRLWVAVDLPSWTPNVALNAVSFFGQDGVVGSQASDTCWWTVNGGQTWQYDQHESAPQALTDINRLITTESHRVSQKVLSAGSFGSVAWLTFPDNAWALSTDGGSHWTLHSVPGSVNLGLPGALSFVNAQDGWMAGAGLYETANGGSQWEQVP